MWEIELDLFLPPWPTILSVPRSRFLPLFLLPIDLDRSCGFPLFFAHILRSHLFLFPALFPFPDPHSSDRNVTFRLYFLAVDILARISVQSHHRKSCKLIQKWPIYAWPNPALFPLSHLLRTPSCSIPSSSFFSEQMTKPLRGGKKRRPLFARRKGKYGRVGGSREVGEGMNQILESPFSPLLSRVSLCQAICQAGSLPNIYPEEKSPLNESVPYFYAKIESFKLRG